MLPREVQIADSVKRTQEQIAAAAARVGRSPSEITLVAVTKNNGSDDVLAAYRSGLRNFGENRVQEALTKVADIPTDVTWHLLGQLQRNKARKAVQFAGLIQSVDRLSLAETLDRIGEQGGREIPVLIEVNIGEQPSKAGVNPAGLLRLLEQVAGLPNVAVKGLMTVAPPVDRGDQARPYFAELRRLFVMAAELKLPRISMEILSMGMTADFTAAIAEGATMVRIGQGIFGSRRY